MEKPLSATRGVTATLAACVLLMSYSPAAAQSASEAKFCSSTNFSKCFTVRSGGGAADLRTKPRVGYPPTWDNVISSVKVGANVRVLAFEHENWTGECIVFAGSAVGGGSNGEYPDLSLYDLLYWIANWNDRITSFQVGGGGLVCPP